MTPSTRPLASRIPPSADQDSLLNGFLAYAADKGLNLYPAQEEALLEMTSGKHIIISTPTGSGKSMVAFAMIYMAMAQKKRAFYTCPIKALVNEKFFALCQELGPENVGMLTGDAAINRDAPVLCCTAEILANMALREGSSAPVDYVIMDEFHYYSDRDRGVAWQIPLLVLSNATFMLMSATLGDPGRFVDHLKKLTGKDVASIHHRERPVPLDYEYRETPLHETVDDLIKQRKYPIYIVAFTQRSAAEEAQNLMSVNFCTKEEKGAINEALKDFRFDTPYGKEVSRFVRHGIGLHHAGLLPKYRLLVEKLSQQGLLKIVCGTDTLGVGVNIPIRTVLFTKLCKFDGEKSAILSAREFHQIGGRAGRKGFDDRGSVVVQAPEHVIENLRIEAKKASDPGKYKKLQKAKPPEKGYVHWDRDTFTKLVGKPPEDLQSRFTISHGMLVNLLMAKEKWRRGGYGRMIQLIDLSHNEDRIKRHQRKHAKLLFKSLRSAGIIRLGEIPGYPGRFVEVVEGLQPDFSLNRTLSLYMLDVLTLLPRDSEEYALNVLSCVESILENPEPILWKQLDRLKGEKVAELKAQGMEYDQRMEELEKLEYPKPLRDFIYGTFNDFSAKHPWVGAENIRPKSVAREMFERCATFHDYIREYELQRSEGLLLRYLSDAYKALAQSVPDAFKDEQVLEIIAFLRVTIRRVDSSLVDEWESMQGGKADKTERVDVVEAEATRKPVDPAADPKMFEIRVRTEMHQLLKKLSDRDYEGALECIHANGDGAWTPEKLDEALKPYWSSYPRIEVGHQARFKKYTMITLAEPRLWDVRQVMVDPEGDNQWMVDGYVDLRSARDPDLPLISVRRIGV